MDDRLDDPLFLRPDTALGVGGAIPFFGTNVDTYAEAPEKALKAPISPQIVRLMTMLYRDKLYVLERDTMASISCLWPIRI